MEESTLDSTGGSYLHSLRRRAHQQIFEANDYDGAAETIKKLQTVAPLDALVHGLKGQLLLALNRIQEGVASLRFAVELAPDDYDACLEYGAALYEYGATCGIGDYIADALTYLRKAVASNPQQPDPYTYIGLCLHEQNDFSTAAEAFREAIARTSHAEEDKMQGYNYLCLGHTLSAGGRWREAIAMYQEGFKLDSSLTEAVEGIAVAYYHEGFLIRAYDIFQKLLPSSRHKNRIIGHLQRIFSEGENYAEAVARYRSAGVELPASVLWLRVGTLVFQRGFVSESLSAFYEAARREALPERVYEVLRNLLSSEEEVSYQEAVEMVEIRQQTRRNELKQTFSPS